MSADVREQALEAAAHHISVVPPRQDGTKRPGADLGSHWKRWQRARPSARTLERWYARGRTGVGFVCGWVSRNLEVLEFDCADTYASYCAVARGTNLGALVERIEAGYLEHSPSGGVHWPYRCDVIAGNTKLARRPKRPEEMQDPGDKVKVLIETRGEGGYIVVAPSHGAVHRSGRPYVLVRGDVATIAHITPDEREALWELARSFDQMPRLRAVEPRSVPRDPQAGDRPGDDFARRASWTAILEPHGWAPVFTCGDVTHWRRPGKGLGTSATTNYEGSDLLWVFSSSTAFEPERGYSKFAAYALLNHGGDFHAAAQALAAQGYGGVGTLGVSDDGRCVRRLPVPSRPRGVQLPPPVRPAGVRLPAAGGRL